MATIVPTVLLVLSALSASLLGVFVLLRNPWRRTHRMFALMTFNLTLWTLGVLFIVHCRTPESATFWIKATFAVASFLPVTFYHFVVFFPHQRFTGHRWVLGVLYAGAATLALLVNTPWYVRGVVVFPDRPPLAHYGPVLYGYMALVCISMFFAVGDLITKLRATSGIQRRQVEHVLISLWAVSGLGSLTNVFAPMLLNIGTLELYGPCFVLPMVIGLAYAMIRYHLLDIWVIVSRTTVYAVVTGFVAVTFMGAVSLVHWTFSGGGQAADWTTTALAALVVVLFIQPIKERAQLILDRIVVHRRYDAKALIERISRNAAEIVRLDELLRSVAEDIRHTLGVNRIRVLLVSEDSPGTIVTEYSTPASEEGEAEVNYDFLLAYIEQYPEPIVLEELLHGWVNSERIRLAKYLAEMEAYLLVPLKTTSGVVGMITLGQKTTRDIYIKDDVKVFATLATPLAAAIENARLYRRLEEVKLHLERVMTNMRGGVVAVDRSGVITTVNQDARDLLPEAAPGKPLEVLEPKVVQLLRKTLQEHRGISDVETVIAGPEGESIPVAMSSSCFDTPSHEILGAMVLIYNMTQIKRLEFNVQRADRLTSIGTMAAGMAHEIKNPLQSIKTFTQLLPHRFEDPDFRRTFAEVVPPEVQRIDMIVTRLLDFARPKPAHFGPRDLAKIITEVLALVENQIRKAGVEVRTEFPEDVREVMADDQRLHQVFLNLILNAIGAMGEGLDRRLTIRMYYERTHLTRKGHPTFFDVPCVRVAVEDTGCGISPEHLEQLFTPFFTTKDDGSGLGLSVVHGIVTEHGGEIDVRSTVGVGTTFTVTLPLARESEVVERVGA